MPRKDKRTTNERKRAMLEAYAETCNIVGAARAARIERKTHYLWLGKDAGYAEAFKKRRQSAADYLESVAVERATNGWLEPVFYQGKKCGSVRRFSDGLLQLLLRGMMPERYGAQKAEISGPGGDPIQAKIEVVFVKPGENAS